MGSRPAVLDREGPDTFHSLLALLLASLRGRQFRDAAFAEFYRSDTGRDRLPPSLLATALPPQPRDEVSDVGVRVGADFDRFPFESGVCLGSNCSNKPHRQRAGDLPFREARALR